MGEGSRPGREQPCHRTHLKKPAEQDEVKLSMEENGNETALQNGTGEEN